MLSAVLRHFEYGLKSFDNVWRFSVQFSTDQSVVVDLNLNTGFKLVPIVGSFCFPLAIQGS